jgi:hypothetical protein
MRPAKVPAVPWVTVRSPLPSVMAVFAVPVRLPMD